MKIEMKAVGMRTSTLSVNNLMEAQNAHNKFIADFDLGASTFSYSYVKVEGKKVADISYNGRIWTTEKDRKIRSEIPSDAVYVGQPLQIA